MAYVNPGWINNSAPAIDAENLNNMSATLEMVPVANGGTGKNSLASGSILKGNGTGVVQEMLGTGAVYAQSTGNPTFGTLPINCGGTGATTLDAARQNLGLTKAGWIAQNEAPSNTNMLWIDTANRNIIKFHDGTQWVACAGAFG